MHEDLEYTRLEQLLRAPAGCALLVMMATHQLSPREAIDPVTALHLLTQAVGQISPWIGVHDELVDQVRRDTAPLGDLARALVREPGIEAWWAPVDRTHQVWIEPESWGGSTFPSPETFPTPASPPSRNEQYTQFPSPHIVTAGEVGGWTGQLTALAHHVSDWHLNYTAQRRRVHIAPDARVLEIVSAEDWHALVSTHGIPSAPGSISDRHPDRGQPWGPNDGLVPDWSTIAGHWDGVHITLWALLTATQVRITSSAGWSELWSRESEETTWLRWGFDAVEEMAPLDQVPGAQPYWLPYPILGNQLIVRPIEE